MIQENNDNATIIRVNYSSKNVMLYLVNRGELALE
jgi:hypothetical protein